MMHVGGMQSMLFFWQKEIAASFSLHGCIRTGRIFSFFTSGSIASVTLGGTTKIATSIFPGKFVSVGYVSCHKIFSSLGLMGMVGYPFSSKSRNTL
ncbi:MAG: hypothetical protein WC875_02580 [Candidatus Absconditabacterales bacterium]